MSTTKARELRRKPTEAESALWKHLRYRQLNGHKFRRQASIGPYIVDFVCLDKRLAIELDGGQHSDQIAYDSERTRWLGSQGLHVLRFWNNQVLKEVEGVKAVILTSLGPGIDDTPHPNLPPQGGKEKQQGLPRNRSKAYDDAISLRGGKEHKYR